MEYEPLRKGISVKHLASDSEKKIQMDIMKIEPGFDDAVHYHDDWEWVYILDGSLEDSKGVHKKGDFLINDTITPHKPKSKEGCTLLIVWCGSVTKE